MGVQEREREMHRPLRRAGLEVIPNAVPDGTMPFVFGFGSEDIGGGFSHRYETPRLVECLNEDWYDLAVSSGLLTSGASSLTTEAPACMGGGRHLAAG
ncbi:hypothetical protein ACFCYI_04390 [Streptomyces sp. NPDC056257]|uniref:hypothetical protein n=1 Tax=Streptomyces sp. NPDC056257 TaxID=3345765 RepID=UPI0035E00BD4